MSFLSLNFTDSRARNYIPLESVTAFHAINEGVTINLKDGRSIGYRGDVVDLLRDFCALRPAGLEKVRVVIEEHQFSAPEMNYGLRKRAHTAKAHLLACDFKQS